ncbi:hypothetical protein [Paenibacillus pedocola]|uniref:hypothetical protein n=1 Tax=Paenibacillus pedocola TaxID=3242193 RepID=UPI00287774BE|nr:hypothetical protein [Paenibacillus typhae]
MGLTSKVLLKALLALSPSILLLLILIDQFPHTGLGRIVALPIIIIMNLLLIVLSLVMLGRLQLRYKVVLWVFIIMVTLCFALLMYPQEYGPSVAEVLWDRISG